MHLGGRLVLFSIRVTVSRTPSRCSKDSRCRMLFDALMSLEGKLVRSLWSCFNLTVVNRDVTDHLQLLLRKAGHHLHTTAEREVVRTMKEKCCYIAMSPSKEEKDSLGRVEDFVLPDGNIVQVRLLRLYLLLWCQRNFKAWSWAFPSTWNSF